MMTEKKTKTLWVVVCTECEYRVETCDTMIAVMSYLDHGKQTHHEIDLDLERVEE